jgi:hypothetical protein
MSFTSGDIMKADLRWQVGNIGLAVNVFQAVLSQDTPHAIADLTVLTGVGGWVSDILAPMATHVVVNCTVTDCNVYKKVGPLWNLVGPAPIVFTPGSIGDPLPSGVAALVTAYTGTSKVVGKKYLPGLSELAQTAGLWVVGVLAAMLQSAVVWITPFALDPSSEGTFYPGVWSLKKAGFVGFVSSVATRDVPAYQRRRKQGVGA